MQNIKEQIERNKEEFDKGFVKEFINDHNGEWRPLRGLWMEDIFEYIHKHNNSSLKALIITLIEEEEKEKMEGCSSNRDERDAYNQAKNDTISRLKELLKEITS